jgi:uncharacterized Zn-finger protein
MSQTFETITVSKKEVSCDGGGGALGHPVIYLEMGEKTDITCPYCSRSFVYKPSKKSA